MMFPILCLLSTAHAEPVDHALLLTGDIAPAESLLGLGWRMQLPSHLQVGAEVRLGNANALYLDGWPVTAGRTLTTLGQLSIPVIHNSQNMLDVRVEAGPRWLAAAETAAPLDRSLSARIAVSPVATVGLGTSAAIQIGWSSLFSVQLQPGVATDAIGQTLFGAGVLALTEDLQLVLRAETGGMFGYDGDGAKYVARAGLGLRWIPGRASSWKNL